ncbi:helix-turn-helix domain-containing protein [Erwinia sp. ErVv1]|uniref:helix-turn-helix domain-containing protein n=1 Tax=Erwinia sp. ErVv1 TaxID=1603299 RepID=UPI00093F2989|nr:helix-turn-helix transcriptional regulator [Erwinia sp. ErVv1]
METLNSPKVLFGRRVKQLRLQAGLSQEAFAHKCGLDRTYVSGIERGLRNPTLEVIAIIARGLEMEIKHLIEF